LAVPDLGKRSSRGSRKLAGAAGGTRERRRTRRSGAIGTRRSGRAAMGVGWLSATAGLVGRWLDRRWNARLSCQRRSWEGGGVRCPIGCLAGVAGGGASVTGGEW